MRRAMPYRNLYQKLLLLDKIQPGLASGSPLRNFVVVSGRIVAAVFCFQVAEFDE